MKKRSIRCYKVYANVYQGVYNYLIYIPLQDGWSSFSFVTCMSCGEIFVIDWDNPITERMSISEIAGNQLCPICKLTLRDTLKKFPEYIRLANGQIGTYNVSKFFSSDNESHVIDFFEIVPH